MGLRNIFAALLFVCWLVPNHHYPWTAAWNDGFVIAVFLLLVPSMFLRAGGFYIFGRSRPLLTIYFLIVSVACVQAYAGQIKYRADAYLVIFYLTLWITAVSVGTVISASVTLQYLISGMLASAVLSAVLALTQFLDVDIFGLYLTGLAPGARAYGNLAQPNNFSTVCFLGLIAASWLYAEKILDFRVVVLLVCLLSFGLVLSGSRTAWLQFATLFLLLLSLKSKFCFSRFFRILGVAVIVYMMMRIAFPFINDALLLPGQRPLSDQLKTGLRLEMWQMSLHAMAQRPWTGFGWQQIGEAQQAVALDFPPHGEHFEHSHNLLIDLLLWNGLPAGMLIIGIMAYWLCSRWLQTSSNTGVMAASIILCVGMHSMVEFPLEYAYFLIPFGLAMGLVEACIFPTANVSSKMNATSVFVWVAMAVFFAVLANEYLRVENRFRDLRLHLMGVSTADTVARQERVVLLDQLNAYMDYIATPATANMSEEQIAQMQIVARRFGYPPILFRLALAMGLNGEAAAAIHNLELICHIHNSQRCKEADEGWRSLRQSYPILPVWSGLEFKKTQ